MFKLGNNIKYSNHIRKLPNLKIIVSKSDPIEGLTVVLGQQYEDHHEDSVAGVIGLVDGSLWPTRPRVAHGCGLVMVVDHGKGEPAKQRKTAKQAVTR